MYDTIGLEHWILSSNANGCACVQNIAAENESVTLAEHVTHCRRDDLLLNVRSPRDCGSCRSRLWYFLSPLDGASVREAHCAQASTAVRRTEAPCAQASTAVRFSARSALRAGYWPTCLTDGHMVVNDHTRSAENWKCVWYFLRPIDGSSACAKRRYTPIRYMSFVSIRYYKAVLYAALHSYNLFVTWQHTSDYTLTWITYIHTYL